MRRFPAFAVLALVPALASAADFTFKVPLQIVNLDERVSSVKVSCTVNLKGGKSSTTTSLSVPIDPGTGNVTAAETLVGVNAPPGVDPRDAINYRCKLIITTMVHAPAVDNPPEFGCNVVVYTGAGISTRFMVCDTSKPIHREIYGSFTSQ